VKRDTRQAVIDATRQVLAGEGLKAVTMRRVAKEVGIAAPSIYRHFTDRDALVRAVMAEGSQLFASYMFKALAEPGPLEQLAATGARYLEFALDHETIFGLMFGAWGELSLAEHSPGHGEGTSPGLQFLIDRVGACAPGVRSREALMELALEQWAVVHGLASLYLHGGGRQKMSRQKWEAVSSRIIRRSAERLASAWNGDAGGAR
jgi:AcrR family transcriptional regulator